MYLFFQEGSINIKGSIFFQGALAKLTIQKTKSTHKTKWSTAKAKLMNQHMN